MTNKNGEYIVDARFTREHMSLMKKLLEEKKIPPEYYMMSYEDAFLWLDEQLKKVKTDA